ncbi:hypothetical protein AB4Z45_28820 [Paenibacillus sp. MCAF9]|uniref:hypothetical protein n=1 Tax=unclassified Paenibacillus TaxID=185978 RepID=UPI0030CE7D2C
MPEKTAVKEAVLSGSMRLGFGPNPPHLCSYYEDKSICIIRKYEVKLFKTLVVIQGNEHKLGCRDVPL